MLKNKKLSYTYFNNNKIRLIQGGKYYFELILKLIKEAKSSIHIQTYIFESDTTGQLVIDALIEAKKRNVDINVLVDGYASQWFSKSLIKEVRILGIQFKFFEPIFKSKHFYFGRRLHHKIIVVDNYFAVTGGINIADHYNDLPGNPAWLDYALFIEGELASQLCEICWKTWYGFPLQLPELPCKIQQVPLNISESEQSPVRIRRNDWVRRKNEISSSYIEMLQNASTDLIFISSYFLPGRILRKWLKLASSRGVRVRIITAGKTDVQIAKHAERWLYNWLLKNNIEVYEYQKEILHAKIGICDNTWYTIGSYNINNISTYSSIELNIDVNDRNKTKEFLQQIETLIADDCVRITPEIKSNNIFSLSIRWLSYQTIKAIFFVFTFYYKRESSKTTHV